MPVNLDKLQEDEEDEEVVNDMEVMEQLVISKLEPVKYGPPRYVHPDISRFYPSKTIQNFPPLYIWDEVCSFALSFMFYPYFSLHLFKLRLCRNLRYPSRPRPIFLQALTKPFTRPWDIDFNLHRLKPVHTFKESPGCKSKEELNRISLSFT